MLFVRIVAQLRDDRSKDDKKIYFFKGINSTNHLQ